MHCVMFIVPCLAVIKSHFVSLVRYKMLPMLFAHSHASGYAERFIWTEINLERGASAVECRTRNREGPGSNPLCYRFEV